MPSSSRREARRRQAGVGPYSAAAPTPAPTPVPTPAPAPVPTPAPTPVYEPSSSSTGPSPSEEAVALFQAAQEMHKDKWLEWHEQELRDAQQKAVQDSLKFRLI